MSICNFIKIKLKQCTSNSSKATSIKVHFYVMIRFVILHLVTLQSNRETTKLCSLSNQIENKTKASKLLVFLTLLHRTMIDQLRDKEFKVWFPISKIPEWAFVSLLLENYNIIKVTFKGKMHSAFDNSFGHRCNIYSFTVE